jgi:Sec-independent protein translocase protein TatA
MFGIGISHILVVAVIGLIFIGPEELPQVMRAIAKLIGQLKRATDDLSSVWHSVSDQGRDYVKDERKQMRDSVYGEDPPLVAPVASPNITKNTTAILPIPDSTPAPIRELHLAEESNAASSSQLSLDIPAAANEANKSSGPQ